MKEPNKLTKQEIRVLNQLQYTDDNYKIGEKLGISHHTVHSHKKSIYRQLDVHNKSDAVIKGIKLGYVQLTELDE